MKKMRERPSVTMFISPSSLRLNVEISTSFRSYYSTLEDKERYVWIPCGMDGLAMEEDRSRYTNCICA